MKLLDSPAKKENTFPMNDNHEDTRNVSDEQPEDIQADRDDTEEAPLPEITLGELPQALQDAVARAGWDKLMPVQAKAVPQFLESRDVKVQSRTGSGKTASFLLPILHMVDPDLAAPQALILAPTRELAGQIVREAEVLYKDTGVSVAAVYGGAGYKQQIEALKAGTHLIVGTPGRVLDHLLKRTLVLNDLKFLVFDEADRMLSVGFYQDMVEIRSWLPNRRVQTCMFSATYPPAILRLADQFMQEPVFISLSADQVHVSHVPQMYFVTNSMEKDRALIRLIETFNPTSAMIFCNTKDRVHYISEVLKGFGYDADELSGDLSQNKREQVLARIRSGELRYLVATDVAARGIDIPDLSHVFLYEPPEDKEVYIHRAGRTGRAGAAGVVVSLVDLIQEVELKRIAKMYKIDLEKRDLPTDEDVQHVVAERTVAMLEKHLRHKTRLEQERIERFIPLAKSLADEEDAARLTAMLLDEFYQVELHGKPPAPPVVSATTKRQQQRGRSGGSGRAGGSGPSNGGSSGRDSKQGNQPASKSGKKRRPRRRKPSGNKE